MDAGLRNHSDGRVVWVVPEFEVGVGGGNDPGRG